MREIKFRAWSNGKMYRVGRLGWSFKSKEPIWFETESRPQDSRGEWLGLEDAVLMQYTGQKSIDEAEVYDGDILSFPEDNHSYFVKWLEHDGAWGVMYSEDLQMAKIGMVRLMQLKGNIYENEELLK